MQLPPDDLPADKPTQTQPGRRATVAEVRDAARGHWRRICLALAPSLQDAIVAGPSRHVDCPVHGGTHGDAFRIFPDFDETGGSICNTCGTATNGIDTLIFATGQKFDDVVRQVSEFLGVQPAANEPRKRGRPRKAAAQGPTTAGPAPSMNGHVKITKPTATAEEIATARAKILARWQQATPDTGRIAAYLAHRGLSVAVPQTLKLSRQTYYDTATGNPVGEFPCMLALFASESNGVVALHRTYLSDADASKAPIEPAKKMTAPVYPGAISGAAIRLFHATGDALAITEGIETGLAVHQVTGLPVWAAGSANGLEKIEIPAWSKSKIRRVELWVDPGEVGETAGEKAAARLTAEGFEAVVICPKLAGASDWLDVLVATDGGQEALLAAQADAVLFQRAPDALPRILVRTKEHIMVDEAVLALQRDTYIFQRGGVLTHVIRDAAPLAGVTRPKGVPRIAMLPIPRLRERLTAVADWVKTIYRGGEPIEVSAHPPEWAVSQVSARGEWPGVRHLEGITEAPVLRPDGSILDTPGYDPKTGLLYEPSCQFDQVPASPTSADVAAAIATLFETVVDFPFETPAHKSAWLASVLTPLARYAFAGPAPMFLIDANIRGAGKSLLCDLAAIIATGREMSRMVNTVSDEEMRKRITAIALSGEPLVMLDNVSGVLGSPAIDAALTCSTWTDRILGKSENTQPMPLNSIWYATGNNVTLKGDISRRTLHIRLESPEEKPERRTDFHHKNIREWATKSRRRLVPAALTILYAYHAAGRPEQPIDAWGSFDGWNHLVRSAIVWAGLPDPGETRQNLEDEADTEASLLRRLLLAWPQIDPDGTGVTVSEIVSKLAEPVEKMLPDHLDLIRNVFSEMNFGKSDKSNNPRQIGYKLRKFKGRYVAGKCLKTRINSDKTCVWFVSRAAGDAGDAGYVLNPHAQNEINENNKGIITELV